MASLTRIIPRSQQGQLQLKRLTAKTSELWLGDEALLLWNGTPIAAFSAEAVYFNHESLSAQTLSSTSWHSDSPHIRASAAQFDFVVGQLLQKVGLRLAAVLSSEAV